MPTPLSDELAQLGEEMLRFAASIEDLETSEEVLAGLNKVSFKNCKIQHYRFCNASRSMLAWIRLVLPAGGTDDSPEAPRSRAEEPAAAPVVHSVAAPLPMPQVFSGIGDWTFFPKRCSGRPWTDGRLVRQLADAPGGPVVPELG
jgi:hypothetical protein